MLPRSLYQLNLQEQFGGGEVYARFFSMALIDLGYKAVLFVSRKAAFWDALLPAGVEIVRVSDVGDFLRRLPRERSLVVTHTMLDAAAAQSVAQRHVLCGFVHMPLYERNPPGLGYYHLLLPVSRHVQDSISQRGYRNVHAQAMYGVAAPPRTDAGTAIVARSEYDWDRRKLRDRLLGLSEPAWRRFRPQPIFDRRPGLTLGIVSRLTPIKQFPLMFSILAPAIARLAQLNLEIFGSGGYASVRDLRESLAPMRRQVRF